MQNTFGQAGSRSFNPMLASKLSEEARRAVNEVFDAMSTWRTETVNSSEKNGEQVIEKMAAAARALGWPEQIVEAIRAQLQSVTKMQIQALDQMMDAWEEQIRSPGSSAMLSKLRSLPGLGAAGSWPTTGGLSGVPVNPLQLWIELTQQWQKAFTDAMGFWDKAARSGGPRRPASS